MSVPQPAEPLDGHCSVIDNNTLYVLSSSSFQSLPLKEHATWSKLQTGQAVTGPSCVRVAPDNDESQAALYVIGGTSQDQSYTGVQRYFFSNSTWETLTPPTANMQGRTNHSVAYLYDSSSILVYAGSQPDAMSDLSSQTFTISTLPPYVIQSYTSEAPPASDPILLSWNSSAAIMLGGTTTNKAIWSFDPDTGGWSQLGTSLSQGLGSQVQASLVYGNDGSRVLETYDATVSPNEVSQIVLMDANGKTAPTGQTIGTTSRKRKRDLTLNNWPAYNATNAPTTIRSDYTVAQGSDGTSVITGGSDDNAMNLFNTQTNGWIDNGLFFTGKSSKNQVPLASSSSSSPSATSTSASPTSSSASATSSSSNSSNGASKHKLEEVLGITLGTLFGLAALFMCILLFLRWRKLKKRREQSYVNEKADRMSFQDRGAPFMKEAGGSVNNLAIPPNHRFDAIGNNSSNKSVNIISGRFGNSRSQDRLSRSDSSESTRQLVRPTQNTTRDMGAPVEMQNINDGSRGIATRKPVPGPAMAAAVGAGAGAAGLAAAEGYGDRKRSSGWSRYFAPNEPQLPEAYSATKHASNTTSSYTNSDSERPSMPSRIPSSVLVPPLDLDFTRRTDGERPGLVAAKSPSFNNSSEDLALRGSSLDAARGQRAQIHGTDARERLAPSRPESLSSNEGSEQFSDRSSQFGSGDFYDGPDASAASTWTPVSNTHYTKPGLMDSSHSSALPRAPSSTYTSSVYGPHVSIPAARGNAGFFPGNRDNYAARPSSRQNRVRSPSSPTFPLPPGTVGNPARGPKSPTLGSGPTTMGLASAKNGLTVERRPSDEERDSTMTVFPRGVPSAYYADRGRGQRTSQDEGRGPAKNIPPQDMSWLNLGAK